MRSRLLLINNSLDERETGILISTLLKGLSGNIESYDNGYSTGEFKSNTKYRGIYPYVEKINKT